MRICIVGHGKSLESKNLGPKIDDCHKVMRLKKGWELVKTNPTDYGGRIDYLLSSTETPGTFPLGGSPVLNEIVYFGYPKYGWYSDMMINETQRMLGKDIVIPMNALNYWNFQFRRIGARHPNFSLGLAGVVIAAHLLQPSSIVLAGMDNIMSPEKSFTRIETVPRTGSGDFPDHDWQKENELLKVLANHYEFHYEDING